MIIETRLFREILKPPAVSINVILSDLLFILVILLKWIASIDCVWIDRVLIQRNSTAVANGGGDGGGGVHGLDWIGVLIRVKPIEIEVEVEVGDGIPVDARESGCKRARKSHKEGADEWQSKRNKWRRRRRWRRWRSFELQKQQVSPFPRTQQRRRRRLRDVNNFHWLSSVTEYASLLFFSALPPTLLLLLLLLLVHPLHLVLVDVASFLIVWFNGLGSWWLSEWLTDRPIDGSDQVAVDLIWNRLGRTERISNRLQLGWSWTPMRCEIQAQTEYIFHRQRPWILFCNGMVSSIKGENISHGHAAVVAVVQLDLHLNAPRFHHRRNLWPLLAYSSTYRLDYYRLLMLIERERSIIRINVAHLHGPVQCYWLGIYSCRAPSWNVLSVSYR